MNNEVVKFGDIRYEMESGMYCNRYGFLHTDKKVDRNSVPKGWFQYELRGDMRNGNHPCKIRPIVLTNFVGTIFTTEELPLVDGSLPVDEDHELFLVVSTEELNDFDELSEESKIKLAEASTSEEDFTSADLFTLFGKMGIIPFIQERDENGKVISEHPMTKEDFEAMLDSEDE